MKRGIILCLCFSLLIAGCVRIERRETNPGPTLPTTGIESTIDDELAISNDLAVAEYTSAPIPDLSSMNFVEKNNLYLQLLDEKQLTGLDTSSADEAYFRSIKASLVGDDAAADEYLHEAILLLWKN